MVFGCADVVPAVHRAAGDAFEDHDVAGAGGGEGREGAVFADTGDQAVVDGTLLRPRCRSRDVRQGQRAARPVVRGEFAVAREESAQLAPACADHDEIVRAGVPFEVVDARLVQHDLAEAAVRELLKPGSALDPLVDTVGGALQRRVPGDVRSTVRTDQGERQAGDVRGLALPVVQAEFALALQRGRGVERALTGHDRSATYLVGVAVGDQGDVIAVRLESQGELGTRRPGSDHRDPSHVPLPCSRDAPIADVASAGSIVSRCPLRHLSPSGSSSPRPGP